MFGITAAAPKNITQKNHRNFFTKVKSKSIIHFVASIGVKSQLQNFSLNSDDSITIGLSNYYSNFNDKYKTVFVTI